MSLYALTEAREIEEAYQALAAHLEAGGETFPRAVSAPEGVETATVRWHADLKLWVLLAPRKLPDHYVLQFGVDDPTEAETVTAICTITPPRSGIDRRCAGVFARSFNGPIYLAHNARVGLGRSVAGKGTFLAYYGDQATDTITWPDKKQQQAIVIGDLHDEEIRTNLADFVHKVDEYRNGERA